MRRYTFRLTVEVDFRLSGMPNYFPPRDYVEDMVRTVLMTAPSLNYNTKDGADNYTEQRVLGVVFDHD